MPPAPPDPGLPRPAAVVQAEIRKLVEDAGGYLWGPTSTRYQALLVEWVAATKAELTTAA